MSLLGLETSQRKGRRPFFRQGPEIPLRGPQKPCTHFAERKADLQGAANGRLDTEAPFPSSPAGRRTLRCPFPGMTTDSLEHHPKPSEAPTGRAWGPAARGNDRARGLWVAAVNGSGYFWPGRAYPPGPRVRQTSQPLLCPPTPIPRRGRGETRVDESGGAGAQAAGGRGSVPGPPPASSHRSPFGPPLHSARTRCRRHCRRARVSRGARLPPCRAARLAWTCAGTS